jgi:hypothetical protein
MLPGILIARVPLDDRRTFCSRHGDVVAWANPVVCVAFSAGGFARATVGDIIARHG